MDIVHFKIDHRNRLNYILANMKVKNNKINLKGLGYYLIYSVILVCIYKLM